MWDVVLLLIPLPAAAQDVHSNPLENQLTIGVGVGILYTTLITSTVELLEGDRWKVLVCIRHHFN